MTDTGLVLVDRGTDPKLAREHALVLEALGIEHQFSSHEDGWLLSVPARAAPFALDQLRQYDLENRNWPPPDEDLGGPLTEGLLSLVLWAFVLFAGYVLQHGRALGIDWTGAGRTEAGAILDGEWWRTITALTLHSDAPHLWGNLVFGAVFAAGACQLLGTPLAWCAILVSAALGNGLNAWWNVFVERPEHSSIGASTAVFAALGILAAARWRQRAAARHGPLHRWSPRVIGFILLTWLGVSDELRIDVGAHLTGFASGAVLGTLLGTRRRVFEARPMLRAALMPLPLVILVVAWSVALAAR